MPEDRSATTRFALATNDGLALRAEWTSPADPRAIAVLCHPHPLHGGNMYAGLIDDLFQQLPGSGFAVLRFNFRGVMGSDGRHDHGQREQLDVLAAVEEAANRMPSAPLVLAGWSFGADLALACPHPAITSWCAIAPPLRVIDSDDMAAATDSRPALILVPEHDQFTPPAKVSELTGEWTSTSRWTIPGADHFLAGFSELVHTQLTAMFD